MRLFFLIINIITAIWMIISAIGYLIYKAELSSEVHTWEDGVKKALTFGFEFVYEELLGKVLPDKLVNPALICSNQEVLELVARLNDHPYDTPVLVSYISNANGIDWYDFAAVGLAPKYKNMANEQIARIACYKIQTFFMETRGCKVALYIKVATPTRLYFAVALSENGRKFLEKQANPTPTETRSDTASTDTSPAPGTLEETIELFPKQDSEDFSR